MTLDKTASKKAPSGEVFLILSSTFPFGVGEEFLDLELKGLVSQKMNVHLVTVWPNGKLKLNSVPSGITHQKIKKYSFSPSIFLRHFFSFVKIERIQNKTTGHFRLKRVVRESLAAAFANQICRIVQEKNVSHIHSYWAAGTAALAMESSKITGVSWSFSAHSWDLSEGINLAGKFRSASGVRFISNRGLSSTKGFHIPSKKLQVIHIGRNISKLDIVANRTEVRHIACIAGLIPIKGHQVLLEAISLLQQRGFELKLDLIGEGSHMSILQESARDLKIENVVSFLGQIKHEELCRKYRERTYDLVVLPSIKSSTGQEEGIPVSLIEAMSFGIPVIATNTGSISELIPLDLNLLVQPNNSEELASKIAEIIEMNPVTRVELVKSCHMVVANHFNIEITAQLWSNWLKLQ